MWGAVVVVWVLDNVGYHDDILCDLTVPDLVRVQSVDESIDMEVSINGGTPIAGWFINVNNGQSICKWMIFFCTPILGNLHILVAFAQHFLGQLGGFGDIQVGSPRVVKKQDIYQALFMFGIFTKAARTIVKNKQCGIWDIWDFTNEESLPSKFSNMFGLFNSRNMSQHLPQAKSTSLVHQKPKKFPGDSF